MTDGLGLNTTSMRQRSRNTDQGLLSPCHGYLHLTSALSLLKAMVQVFQWVVPWHSFFSFFLNLKTERWYLFSDLFIICETVLSKTNQTGVPRDLARTGVGDIWSCSI